MKKTCKFERLFTIKNHVLSGKEISQFILTKAARGQSGLVILYGNKAFI
jgi:hypothetical protein